MLIKPIALMYYPDDLFIGTGGIRQTIEEVIKVFNKSMPDYHWLCFPKEDIEVPELQVFFDKDFTPIQYDELLEKIKNKALCIS